MRSSLKILVLNILLFTVISMGYAHATGSKKEPTPQTILKTLDQTERELNRKSIQMTILEAYFKKLPEYRIWAIQCLQAQESELRDILNNIDALGEYSKGESVDVTKKRQSIKNNQSASEKLLATCKLILLRSDESINRITQLKQSYLAEKYFIKGPSFITLIKDNWENPGVWLNTSKIFIQQNSGLDILSLAEITILILIIATGILSGLNIRDKLRLWLKKHPPGDNQSSHLARALVQTSIRYTPYLLASSATAIFFYLVTHEVAPVPFISILAYGLPIVTVFLFLIYMFLHSSLELKVIKAEQENIAKKLSHRLKLLVLLGFFGYLLFATILSQSLPESALLLTRAIYGAVIIVNLIMIIWLVSRFNRIGSTLLFRLGVSLLFICSLIAELYGYRNISTYILKTVLGTIIITGLFSLISTLARELIDNLESGKGHWQLKLHTAIGLKPDQNVPGMIWIRLITTLLLWSALIASLIVVWEVPDTYVQALINSINLGFTIGSVEILPLRIIQAILILPVLLTINAWFRKGLEHKWLNRTKIERSARESMATIAGYIGISITIIVALSIAGMDFSKLAIIAGALSVGIGFGLQNIVNNFVSGLILLFERPIKTGDWIEVGNIEGYVRKISIRSTQIQTFDRADVIVPNSELISGTVTNWMLRDKRGRIRVPVGVAYGTDINLVKELLLQVAKENSAVINGSFLVPDADVLFMGFGDSSLDFELRCHIQNIDSRLLTISEINFAIDAIFRKNHIEIPFPQRDLYIRDKSPTTQEPNMAENNKQSNIKDYEQDINEK